MSDFVSQRAGSVLRINRKQGSLTYDACAAKSDLRSCCLASDERHSGPPSVGDDAALYAEA